MHVQGRVQQVVARLIDGDLVSDNCVESRAPPQGSEKGCDCRASDEQERVVLTTTGLAHSPLRFANAFGSSRRRTL